MFFFVLVYLPSCWLTTNKLAHTHSLLPFIPSYSVYLLSDLVCCFCCLRTLLHLLFARVSRQASLYAYFSIFYSFGFPFFLLRLINGECLQPTNGWSDRNLGTACASYMPICCFQLPISILDYPEANFPVSPATKHAPRASDFSGQFSLN